MFYTSKSLIWIPLYATILYFVIKNYKKQSLWIILFFALLITITDQASVKLFKEVFERFRPCHDPFISHLVHKVHNKCGGPYSFVSSHATNTFGVAVFSSLLLYKKYKYVWIPLILWCSFVSYSRVYLGVHYPGDILGGAILGSSIAFTLFFLLKFIQRKSGKMFINIPENSGK